VALPPWCIVLAAAGNAVARADSAKRSSDRRHRRHRSQATSDRRRRRRKEPWHNRHPRQRGTTVLTPLPRVASAAAIRAVDGRGGIGTFGEIAPLSFVLCPSSFASARPNHDDTPLTTDD